MADEIDAPGEHAEETQKDGYSPDDLAPAEASGTQAAADVNLDLVLEVPVTVSLQVGQTEIPIRDLVGLTEGSVVALERNCTDPMDVMVNGKLIAHGEIVLVDESFGVRLTDVISPAERILNVSQSASSNDHG